MKLIIYTIIMIWWVDSGIFGSPGKNIAVMYINFLHTGDFAASDKPGDWYPDHILSWYKHRDNKNVYFLYYEDMKKVKMLLIVIMFL